LQELAASLDQTERKRMADVDCTRDAKERLKSCWLKILIAFCTSTPTLKLACPIPSSTKMVKTAAQLKDHYTNSHTDCMMLLHDRVRGREDNGTPKQERQTDGIPHQMARV
jgi:hypothetical protein